MTGDGPVRILVIDDEDVIRGLMMEILESGGYEVTGADTAERALALLGEDEFSLVVSDVVMPGLSGLELLEAVHARQAALPVVLVTGAGTYDMLSQALMRGAAGLVTKPFAHADLLNAVADALARATRSRDELRTRLLAPTLASALANAIEARDSYLHGHCERLAALAVRIAELLGLAREEIEHVRLGAILHDVGKIGIPDSVLLKPGPLDGDELAVVQTHPLIGDRLLAPLDLLEGARPIVRHHHERWDGTGYPRGLTGQAIPIGARIVAVADAVEAMTSRTLYSAPLDREGVLDELRRHRGTQWDPKIVDVVFGMLDRGELSVADGGLRLAESREAGAAAPAVPILLVELDTDAALTAAAIEQMVNGAAVSTASTVAAAVDLVRDSAWSLAVVNDRLPDGSGLQVLDALHLNQPEVPVMIVTGRSHDETAVEAIRRGASDYLVKTGDYRSAVARRARDLVLA